MRFEGDEEKSELSQVAAKEEEFVRERLMEELGREPTQEELDEWLREHTESY
jgi:hypothetical protein